MDNNDILRSLRYTLNLEDGQVIALFKESDFHVSREQVCNWLKKEDDPDMQKCTDTQLSIFLNGLISARRGQKDGPPPAESDRRLNNNVVLRRLKIAFDLTTGDIAEIMEKSGKTMSQHEISAFFRRPDHKHYRPCRDQVLRHFLKGLQLRCRPQSVLPDKK